MGVGGQRYIPTALTPGETPDTIVWGWVGPRAHLDRCRKYTLDMTYFYLKNGDIQQPLSPGDAG
jgi:hypothetical protein